MPNKKLIKNATIVNEGEIYIGSVLIEDEFIKKIYREAEPNIRIKNTIDATGLYLLPGMIDDQVHFRDPGLTHKGDLFTESRAAIAGGITSFMDMPNTNPRTLTQELLDDKYKLAAEKSLANYSFYMGTSNDNLEEVLKTNPGDVCGIKIFLGASTGNMLVDNQNTIEKILDFSAQTGIIVTVHCEHEPSIIENIAKFKEKYGDDIKIEHHPLIRDDEVCYKSSFWIVGLARKHHANLHILHLTTHKELKLLDSGDVSLKHITAEVCVHHLWFSDQDYAEKGNFIKWNPAIKSIEDRNALRDAVNSNLIDIIATDHAPHTLAEKSGTDYFKIASGGPLVQHALVASLELYHQGIFDLNKVVEKTSHNVAKRFKIDRRGFIRSGYYADMVLVDLHKPWTVKPSNVLYKCAWSPFEGTQFQSQVTYTFINGHIAYHDDKFWDTPKAMRLVFKR
jgi:dihydroorotase